MNSVYVVMDSKIHLTTIINDRIRVLVCTEVRADEPAAINKLATVYEISRDHQTNVVAGGGGGDRSA